MAAPTRDLSVIGIEADVLTKVETMVDDTICILSAAREALRLEPDTADLEKSLRQFGDDVQDAREHRQRILQRVADFGGVMGLPEQVTRDLRDCADRGAGYRWGSLALTERDVQALVATRERTEVSR